MATKLLPAHRTRDGQPIKTTDIARAPKRPRGRAHTRAGDYAPTHAPTPTHACACPRPHTCACEEAED